MNYYSFDGLVEGFYIAIGVTAVSAFVGAKVAKNYGQSQVLGAVVSPIIVFVALKVGNDIKNNIKRRQNAGIQGIQPSMTTPLM